MSKPDIRGRLEADPVYWIDMEYAALKYLRENPPDHDTLNRDYVKGQADQARAKIAAFIEAGTLTGKQYEAEWALQKEYDKP